VSKEIHVYVEETHIYVQRDQFSDEQQGCLGDCQQKKHSYVKRDPYVCQKRPIFMLKETYLVMSNRAASETAKIRPIYMSKEIHMSAKKDLYICPQRPT